MNIDSLVSRLQRVNNELMTISSLRKIQDMSERRGKPCSCPHHRSNSASRSSGDKCYPHAREKKKSCCSCRQRPKSCLCNREKNDQIVTVHKSTSPEIADEPARQSEKSLHRKEPERNSPQESFQKIAASKIPSFHERPKEILRDIESTSPEIDDESTRRSAKSLHWKEPERISPQESLERNAASERSSLREKPKEMLRAESSVHADSSEKSPGREKSKETIKDGSADDAESLSKKMSRHEEQKEISREEFVQMDRSTERSRREDPRGVNRHSESSRSKESFVKLYDPARSTEASFVRKSGEMTQPDRYTLNRRKNLTAKPEKVNSSAVTSTATRTDNISADGDHSTLGKLNGEEKNIEKMYKELTKRNLELEEKLKTMDCGMSCLRSEGESQAACLKEALEKAKAEAGLASRSRNLAMDLAKQSRDQTESVKASRDEIANRMNIVDRSNAELRCECEKLRGKLEQVENDEKKMCAEVEDKVNRIQCAAKQKEMTLTSEKSKLEKSVGELTNHVKTQKKRISDLTLICTNQRDLICANENCISMKMAQLTEAEDEIQSTSCKCRQMQDQVDDLQCRLNEETIARENLQKELDKRQDNCDCELRIKNKIIEDQIETIKKLKRLLQDSEKMAHQAACEFESLRDELHCLKQSNKSLRMALEEYEERTNDEYDGYCDRCNVLEERMKNLEEQRQKALAAAKFAAAKLCSASAEYERQIDTEKRRNEYANNSIERQNVEIRLLKKEILCVKEFRSRRSNDCIDRQ